MTGTTSTERIEEIADAIKMFKKLAAMAQESADGWAGKYFPNLREKWLKQARRRRKAVVRLTRLLGKEFQTYQANLVAAAEFRADCINDR